jgi:hypothetical protein
MAYKVVEISTVTDEEIERVLNDWAGRGWSFSSIQFIMTEASRRPAMAFVLFTGKGGADGAGAAEGTVA